MWCRRCTYRLDGLRSGVCPECGRSFDPERPETVDATKGQTRAVRHAWMLGGLGLLVGLAFMGAALESIGVVPNSGLPFGYYGRANRIIDRFADIEGVVITDVSYHRDGTLEDFVIEWTFEGEGPYRERFHPRGRTNAQMRAQVGAIEARLHPESTP